MSTYLIVPGDTWSLIARKVYGVETEASRLARANPGHTEPLSPGTAIFTPPSLLPAPFVHLAPSINQNEVVVLIDGKRFRKWVTVTINRSLDGIDSASFSTSTDVLNGEFTAAFQPFSFATIEVYVGGEPLFTGVMMKPAPTESSSSTTLSMECYGNPGVLMDCSAPPSDFPIEYNDMNLLDIARSLCEPFGIQVVSEEDPGPTFDRVALNPSTRIFPFLANLGQQRNLLFASSPTGQLVMLKAVEQGKPVASLASGQPPVTSISADFDPQKYYSHVTGMQPALFGIAGEQHTVTNTRLNGVLRPFIFSADDTEEGNLKAAVEAKAGLMFGNSVKYTVGVSSWRTPLGKLWSPNTTIKLVSARAYIPNPYEFLVHSVAFNRTANAETAELQLVLPGSFSGKIPEKLPWAS